MIRREYSQPRGRLDATLDSLREECIRGALAQAGGHVTLAAKLLGISRSRIYIYMARLNIDPDESRLASFAKPRIAVGRSTRSPTLDERTARAERDMINAAIRRSGGHKTNAARALGVSRSRLYWRMEALGITA